MLRGGVSVSGRARRTIFGRAVLLVAFTSR
jgi:hypothetical protein